jgi:hypothetical protein
MIWISSSAICRRGAKWTAWGSQHDGRLQQRHWALSNSLGYLWWPFVVGLNVPYIFSNVSLARFIVLLHIIAFVCPFWSIMHTLFSFFNTVLCELSLIIQKHTHWVIWHPCLRHATFISCCFHVVWTHNLLIQLASRSVNLQVWINGSLLVGIMGMDV